MQQKIIFKSLNHQLHHEAANKALLALLIRQQAHFISSKFFTMKLLRLLVVWKRFITKQQNQEMLGLHHQ